MLNPHPHLRQLEPVHHGGISVGELSRSGLPADAILDFSTTTSPLGPSPAVRAALAQLEIGRYPDDQATKLRAALGELNGVSTEQVVVGNGSSELIWLLALAYLGPGDRVLIVGPTFGEYAHAARIVGAEPIEVRARSESDFVPPLEEILSTIRANRPQIVFLGNPNNPTGTLLSRAEIQTILAADGLALLVVDEAYRAFSPTAPALEDLLASGQLFLLRSLTKDYALAGLRLGYGLGAPALIEPLWRVRPPWSINRAAQDAGLAALADSEHLARSLQLVQQEREYLYAELTGLGLKVYPPGASFLLVQLERAAELGERLLRRGFALRDCQSFGLPDHLRVGVRTRPECQRLIAALTEELALEPATRDR